MHDSVADERIKEAVRQTYGGIARRFVEEPARATCCGPTQVASCCGPSETADTGTSCCGPSQEAVETMDTAARLYSTEELAGMPDSVTDISLGCGNPTAIAELQLGEVVLDLGSGGGIDCFLAAKKVGSGGHVIGLDMTPSMVKLARRNAKKVGATNVEFRYGEMEDIPLVDESVDVIISNCVINLSPDKDAVFGEAYRVLRPGGRMSVSDIVVDGSLPLSLRERLDAWAGCVAGALDESDYLSRIHAAGFEDVEVESRTYVTAAQIADSEEAQLLVVGADGKAAEAEGVRALLAEAGLSVPDLVRKIASIKVKAHKPA